jgi:hypothetical protein
MRHSTITLTMDACGHLFPGQDARTVHHLPDFDADEEPLRATGTADAPLEHQEDHQQKRQRS